MKNKCRFCKEQDAYGYISEKNFVEFGFGSKYDWDTYKLNFNLSDLGIKINKTLYDSNNICDNCFDELFKENSTLVDSIFMSVGDDLFWLRDVCEVVFPDQYTIEYEDIESCTDRLSIEFWLFNNHITLPVFAQHVLNTPYISSKNIETFLVALHPSDTLDPVFLLVSKRDSEFYKKYKAYKSKVINLDLKIKDYSDKRQIDLNLDDDMIPLSYMWVYHDGSLVFYEPHMDNRLLLNNATCIYKNALYTLKFGGNPNVYLLEDVDGNITRIDLAELNKVRCSFNINYETKSTNECLNEDSWIEGDD